MKLYIKYMVSLRCKMVVKEALEKIGLHYVILELGTVETMKDLTEVQRKKLHKTLLMAGLELMDDKKAMLIEKLKTSLLKWFIIQMNFLKSIIPIISAKN